jgi:hypothetical protein
VGEWAVGAATAEAADITLAATAASEITIVTTGITTGTGIATTTETETTETGTTDPAVQPGVRSRRTGGAGLTKVAGVTTAAAVERQATPEAALGRNIIITTRHYLTNEERKRTPPREI